MRTRILLAGVLTFGSWGCGGPSAVTASLNQRAALAGSLPRNPLEWRVIASFVDKPASTMSTLYGNDAAVLYARSNSEQDFPPGSELALVTWTEQEDTHWFGGKIPGQVKSVEFVTVAAGAGSPRAYTYENYAGTPLVKISASNDRSPGSRAEYLLTRRAAVMP